MAWQSRQEEGCAGELSDAWNFCEVFHVSDKGGERWQSEQSSGTAGVVVGAPFDQITASNGKWSNLDAHQWTSGFFAGALWQMHKLTLGKSWRLR